MPILDVQTFDVRPVLGIGPSVTSTKPPAGRFSVFGRLSIRTLVIATMSLMVMQVAGVLLWNASQGWKALRQAEQARSFDVGANRYVDGLFNSLIERVTTNNALQANDPADASMLDGIAKLRSGVAENYGPGLTAISTFDFPDRERLLSELKAPTAAMMSARAGADQDMKLPKEGRSVTLRKEFVPTFVAFVAASLHVWFSALPETAAADPLLTRLAVLKELGWRMRDESGFERANISAALSAGAAIAPDKLAESRIARARVDVLWDQALNLARDFPAASPVRHALNEAVDLYFHDFRSLADEMIEASRIGTGYAMTASAFTARTTPQIGALLGVMRAASVMSEARNAVIVAERRAELWFQSGVLLVALLASAAMLLVLRAQVLRPLSKLAGFMGSMSAGRLDGEVPGLNFGREIALMASAVESFRQAGIAKTQLEREATRAAAAAEAIRQDHEQEGAKRAAALAVFIAGFGSAIERLASGDLMVQIDGQFAREYEKLRSDFNGSAEQLREALAAVVSGATAITSGAAEIAEAADDLSRRTEHQAATLEQTAAALHGISARIVESAQSTRNADAIVATAKLEAEQGSGIVCEVVSAMGGIEASSREVTQIISVIDEIAFQTNLLALNAGVEAARAGDAGRGFAVVASEVRALAKRSAEAAKEIKALIAASTAQVGRGVALARNAGAALESIVGQVSTLKTVISEIASGANSQAVALREVSAAVNSLDQATQQNAAMVEETTAASHSLRQEAGELMQSARQFKVDHIAAVRGSPHLGQPAAKVVPQREYQKAQGF